MSISTGNGTANYTPAGSVSAPTISVATAGSTTTVNSITAVGTLPSLGATVTDEVLTLSWDAGTLPTKGANTTVKTGDASYSATAPTFTGTGAELVGSFTGTSLTSTGSFTPDGVVKFKRGQAVMNGSGQSAYWTISWQSALDCISLSSVLTAGTTKYFHPSFTGTSGSVSVTGTPEGTVSQPTFSGSELTSTGSFTPAGTIKFKAATSASAWGTAASYLKLGTVLTAGTSKYLHSAFTGTSGSVSVTGTPEGTVSQPTFSGSELTSTGSFTSAGTIKFKAATSASAWGTAASYLKLGTVLTAGTSKYLHSAFTGTSGSVSVTGTPSGTVSQPTFSGTAASITST